MRSARLLVGCLFVFGATACSAVRPAKETKPAPQSKRSSAPAARLGVPPGHLPPPGQCRVWVPGTPPGRQSPARDCAGIERSAAAGSWILVRPRKDNSVVHVKVVDERRAGAVVQLRIYDADRGTLISEK